MSRLLSALGVKPAHVFVPAAVVAEMAREAEFLEPEETGGVLLGYCGRDDPLSVQVVRQVGPGPGAVHARHRFEPDSEWQYAQIARAYERSGRILTYLGDWHSHPGGSARPSRTDRRTAKRIARTRQARARRPLMLILWGGSGAWSLAAHQWRRRRLREAGLVEGADAQPRGDYEIR